MRDTNKTRTQRGYGITLHHVVRFAYGSSTSLTETENY
jgi:hypothetical protein